MDLWFSTEGTQGPETNPVFLDGDVLSAKSGTIVYQNSDLFAASVPAGIPTRGVDFGVDSVTASRTGQNIHFSTEILYQADPAFTDGDILNLTGLVEHNVDLIACFEPRADFLGLDALFLSDLQQPEQSAPAATNASDPAFVMENRVTSVGKSALLNCRQLAYSTEEDFLTMGPTPPDGNPIISDGDLLAQNCAVCARNADLLNSFDVTVDLGLDAADVIDADAYIVAFSTELDSPAAGQFTAGDLLVTNASVIPNQALTAAFGDFSDLGLDGIHFAGNKQNILSFLDFAYTISRAEWLRDPTLLAGYLNQYNIDIWFSTEGTKGPVSAPLFLDGDILSAKTGTIVRKNSDLFDHSVPAGIPLRGVDFGVDAFSASRVFEPGHFLFSTEILFRGEPAFTDGDVLLSGSGVWIANKDLILCFEPKANFLGLDALSVNDFGWPQADLGDAPDSTNHPGNPMPAYPSVAGRFPTVFDPATGLPSGPQHFSSRNDAWLGPWITLENDADLPLDEDLVNNLDPDIVNPLSNQDGADDGVIFPVPFAHCQPAVFEYIVTIPPGAGTITRYVNVWFDWNRDGDWDDSMTCSQQGDAPEWAVQNKILSGYSPGTYVLQTPQYLPWNMPDNQIEGIWMRISIAEQPAPSPWDGRGPAGGYEIGETEDYFLPRQCLECADFDASGKITLSDLNVVSGNWLWMGPVGGFNDADLNCNGKVDLNDFAILARQWLAACP